MALLKFLQHRGAGFGLAGILLHARCPLAVERLAVTQSQPISPSSCLLGLSLCLLLSSFAIDALDLSSRSRHATAHFPKFPVSTLYSRSQVKSSQSVSQSVISRSRPALTPPPARSPAPPLPVEHKYRVLKSSQVKSSAEIGPLLLTYLFSEGTYMSAFITCRLIMLYGFPPPSPSTPFHHSWLPPSGAHSIGFRRVV